MATTIKILSQLGYSVVMACFWSTRYKIYFHHRRMSSMILCCGRIMSTGMYILLNSVQWTKDKYQLDIRFSDFNYEHISSHFIGVHKAEQPWSLYNSVRLGENMTWWMTWKDAKDGNGNASPACEHHPEESHTTSSSLDDEEVSILLP